MHPVHFPLDFFPSHIDCTFVPLRPGLILTNPDRPLRDGEEKLFLSNDWEFVSAPEPKFSNAEMPDYCQSSKWLSMNVLSISPTKVVCEEQEKPLQELLSGLGLRGVHRPVPKRLRVWRVITLRDMGCSPHRDVVRTTSLTTTIAHYRREKSRKFQIERSACRKRAGVKIGLISGDGLPISGLLTVFRNVFYLGRSMGLFDDEVVADLGYSWRADKSAILSPRSEFLQIPTMAETNDQ